MTIFRRVIVSLLLLGVYTLPCLSQEVQHAVPVYTDLSTDTSFQRWFVVGPIPVADTAAVMKEQGIVVPERKMPFPEIYTMEDQEWLGWEVYYPVFIDDSIFQSMADITNPHSPIQPFAVNNTVYQCETVPFEQARIDLTKQFGLIPNTFVYVVSDIQVDTPKRAQLAVVSDDAMKLWLNGELVYSFLDGRSVTAAKDLIRIQFQEGLNRLCLKVMNFHGEWGFEISINELSELPIDRKVAESVSRISEAVGEDENLVWTVVIIILALFLLFAGFLILVKLYASNEKLNG